MSVGASPVTVSRTHHANGLAVFFAEERKGAHRSRRDQRHLLELDRAVTQKLLDDEVLYAAQLVGGGGGVVVEVEAQVVRRDQRTLLMQTRTEYGAKS